MAKCYWHLFIIRTGKLLFTIGEIRHWKDLFRQLSCNIFQGRNRPTWNHCNEGLLILGRAGPKSHLQPYSSLKFKNYLNEGPILELTQIFLILFKRFGFDRFVEFKAFQRFFRYLYNPIYGCLNFWVVPIIAQSGSSLKWMVLDQNWRSMGLKFNQWTGRSKRQEIDGKK